MKAGALEYLVKDRLDAEVLRRDRRRRAAVPVDCCQAGVGCETLASF
jgi:hypothetical protein